MMKLKKKIFLMLITCFSAILFINQPLTAHAQVEDNLNIEESIFENNLDGKAYPKSPAWDHFYDYPVKFTPTPLTKSEMMCISNLGFASINFLKNPTKLNAFLTFGPAIVGCIIN